MGSCSSKNKSNDVFYNNTAKAIPIQEGTVLLSKQTHDIDGINIDMSYVGVNIETNETNETNTTILEELTKFKNILDRNFKPKSEKYITWTNLYKWHLDIDKYINKYKSRPGTSSDIYESLIFEYISNVDNTINVKVHLTIANMILEWAVIVHYNEHLWGQNIGLKWGPATQFFEFKFISPETFTNMCAFFEKKDGYFLEINDLMPLKELLKCKYYKTYVE